MPAPAREKIWLGKRNNTDKSLMTDLDLTFLTFEYIWRGLTRGFFLS